MKKVTEHNHPLRDAFLAALAIVTLVGGGYGCAKKNSYTAFKWRDENGNVITDKDGKPFYAGTVSPQGKFVGAYLPPATAENLPNAKMAITGSVGEAKKVQAEFFVQMQKEIARIVAEEAQKQEDARLKAEQEKADYRKPFPPRRKKPEATAPIQPTEPAAPLP